MRTIKIIWVTVFAVFILAGCSNNVTKQTQVVDTRPVITFSVNTHTNGMFLFVDDLNQGALSDYEYPKSAIRLLPGQHKIEIKKNHKVVYSDTRYFSEGVDYKIDVTIQP